MNQVRAYKSREYVGGVRLYTMRKIADGFFGDSLIHVCIADDEEIFVVKIKSTAPLKQIKAFTQKYNRCRIEPFLPLPLSEVCKDCKVK